MNGTTTMNVAKEKRSLRVLTNSELSCFRRCQREHHFRYRLLRRPIKQADALRFGTLIHKALEAWWLAPQDPQDRLSHSWQAIREKADDSDPFEVVKACELMLGYTARWGEDGTTVIAVEAQFRATLSHPITGEASGVFELGGKLDVVTEHGFIEHKTTSLDIGLGSDYWRRVSALDSQVSMYTVGMRALGVTGSCTYDVIRKPAIRPLRATPEASRKYKKDGTLYANQRENDETPEEYGERLRADIEANPENYFARGEVVRLENDEFEHAVDVWHIARMMLESEQAGQYPRNPDACMRYKRPCEYFPVCSGEASIDDDTLYRTAESAHEELEEEKEIQ